MQSEKLRIIIKFAYTADHNTSTIFGSETSGIKGSGEYSICPYGTPSFFVGGSQSLTSAYTPSINEIITLDVIAASGNLTDIWNKTIQKTQTYTQSLNKTYSIAIFGNNISNKISQLTSMRLYSFELYDNGQIKRNFIPCKNSSGTIGLYDTINNKFFTNKGTGTFKAGPEVKEKIIYIKTNDSWMEIIDNTTINN